MINDVKIKIIILLPTDRTELNATYFLHVLVNDSVQHYINGSFAIFPSVQGEKKIKGKLNVSLMRIIGILNYQCRVENDSDNFCTVRLPSCCILIYMF